jgi:hypothetical protein
MKKTLIALTLGAVLGLAALPTRADILLSEDFSYADGVLTNVSNGKWVTHSGTLGQVDVAGGILNLTTSESEDVNTGLTGAPYSAGTLYSSFKAKWTALPSATGAYLAHFKDATTGFRGRVFACLSNAPAGGFRLGISGAASTFTVLPQDLALNTVYTIVLKWDLGANTGSLWVNPVAETDPNVVSTDVPAAAAAISSFAFRQATGIGTLTVDNLIVGTTFADVTGAQPATPPSISKHPQSQTVLEGSHVELTVTASGTAPLAYQWRRNTNPITDATNFTYTINSVSVAQSGSYDVVVTNSAGTAISDPAQLTVNAVAIAPQITQDLTPLTQTVNPGATVTYTVSATGTAPLSYQWFKGETLIDGQTTETLTLTSVTLAASGTYKVVVSNTAGSKTSAVVTLNVELPPPATIASLRAMLDPVNFVPTNTTAIHSVEGVVTTHINLTGPSANVLFYMQDATAGIAVFWTGGTNQFVPRAGDRVRVTAPLTAFNGLLELGPNVANSAHSVTLLSSGNPLPAPVVLDLNWQTDPVTMERYEGTYMVISNVLVDLSGGTTFLSGRTNGISDASGMTFAMFADARTDIVGQAKPTTPVTILGVLGQFDASNPRNEAYQLIPTRFADILSSSKAATVRFTNTLDLIRKGDAPVNTYTEFVLQPGETITIQATITDSDGRVVRLIVPTDGLPASAFWTIPSPIDTYISATFTYKATAAEAGQLITPTLSADNGVALNTTTWKIYVPTAAEQKVTIGEFLANPASTNTAPHFNPLRRSLPDPLPAEYVPSSSDEYVEIINLAGTDIDLAGWTISDSASMRHKFYESFPVAAGSAAIAYGGPRNSYQPGLDVPTSPASENVFFGFNDTGGDSIILRNAEGNLICRVVYVDATLSSKSSVTRFPDSNGVFLPQVWVSTNSATPGRQFDGRLWSEPAPQLVSQQPITVQREADGTISLNWAAVAGKSYTLWQTDTLGRPFSPKFYGLTFTNTTGRFIDTSATNAAKRFYWISTP